MNKYADLHIHTHFSDSTLSPREVIEEAQKQNLSCISITDHDAIDGIRPAQDIGRDCDVEVVAGIEISCEEGGKDIHMLGYFFDTENERLLETLKKMRQTRVERIKKFVDNLKAAGIKNIEAEEVFALNPLHSIGRVHLATVLKQKKIVASIPQAFEKYLGEDSPYHVPKFKITAQDAISLISQAGGAAVVAHPMMTGKDELIPGFVQAGLKGIEVYYPNCSQATIQHYEDMARQYNLAMTGGSDGHGKAKTNTYIGKMRIPYDLVLKLKDAASH